MTSTDVGGNTSVATRTYVVTDLQGAMAFTRAGKIWITKVSGAGSFVPRQLTQLAGLDAAGSWVDDQASISPDGRRVVFARRPASPASAKRQIWVIDSTGRNAKNLTNDPGQDYNAAGLVAHGYGYCVRQHSQWLEGTRHLDSLVLHGFGWIALVVRQPHECERGRCHARLGSRSAEDCVCDEPALGSVRDLLDARERE